MACDVHWWYLLYQFTMILGRVYPFIIIICIPLHLNTGSSTNRKSCRILYHFLSRRMLCLYAKRRVHDLLLGSLHAAYRNNHKKNWDGKHDRSVRIPFTVIITQFPLYCSKVNAALCLVFNSNTNTDEATQGCRNNKLPIYLKKDFMRVTVRRGICECLGKAGFIAHRSLVQRTTATDVWIIYGDPTITDTLLA